MILNKINILMVLTLLTYSCFSQQKAPRLFSNKIMSEQIDTLRYQFSNNKYFYEKYELQTLIALTYYPELKDTEISFKRRELKTTMAARPKGFEVFGRKGKRHYVIYINDFPSAKIPPDSISFNAQIGVLGHELAHILEYEQMSSLKIMFTGLSYFNKKFKARFERATDQRTVEHGLLWQCYDFAVFVYSYKNAPENYIEMKKKNYMSPDEIKKQFN